MNIGHKMKQNAVAFLKDESGQNTVEYALLLLFVVVAVKTAGGQLKDRLSKIMDSALGKASQAVDSAETQ